MSEENMIKVSIDGVLVEVPLGTSIIEAARKIGGNAAPPAMCYYSKLEGSGGRCRTCLVEVSKGSEKDPRPMPKLVASCRTAVMDGMEVKVMSSDRVKNAREGVTEFLLLNHPLDCPVCDQAGECQLQDLGYQYGKDGTRTQFERREYDSEDIGPYVKLHMNRCILCARCVLVANQLTEQREHGILYRGDHAEIGTYLNKAITNDFSGNIIDVCPVGALTDKTFRFKSRVWFTRPMDAHCQCEKCSGKAVLWMRGDEILRVSARKNENGEVEEFICNTCRFERKNPSDWVIQAPRKIKRTSVIGQNHYELEEPAHKILKNSTKAIE